jgi:CubicO group peptidase (beta-lactamase class C family)
MPWLLPRRVAVPDSPAAVTTAATDRETDPREAGMTPEGVAAIWRAAEALYLTRTQPALALCVRRHGKVVLDRAIGHSHGNGPHEGRRQVPAPGAGHLRLATPDTPFCIFSASKAVTALLVHLMDERSLLRLDDPVAEYIPEFARHRKGWATIRHVLTHRAGIPSIAGGDAALDLLSDPDRVIAALCDAHPTSRPGRQLAYHAVTGGFILGEIVRRVTGRSIAEVLMTEIAAPLGCAHLTYGVAPDRIAEVAVNHVTGSPIPWPLSGIIKRALGVSFEDAVATSNDPRFLSAVVPSGNIVATADDLSRFFQCLLDDGLWQGRAVFDRRTVRRARVESAYREVDLTLGLPLRYGQGLMLGSGGPSVFGPDTRRAFGHYGFVNIIGWADPTRATAVALLTSGKPIVAGHMLRFWRLLSAISERCPPVRGQR